MAFTKPKEKKALTAEEAYPRLLRFCAYQERSPAEVVRKMQGFGLETPDQEMLLERLKEENYLSEDRFTSAYTGGKLRQNNWGKVKIRMGLAQKGISREKAQEAIGELDPAVYRAQLEKVLRQWWDGKLKHSPPFEAKSKLYKVGLSRGFESSLVGDVIKDIMGAADSGLDLEFNEE